MSHPPKNGPMAVATPPRPDQAPTARARSSGWNTADRIARLPGTSSAAPIPCTARARTSSSTLGATPHRIEAAVKPASPITKTRRRPYRSPREPPRSTSAVRVTR